MKILIVTKAYPPALSTDARRPYYFAQSMLAKGWEVDVLTTRFTDWRGENINQGSEESINSGSAILSMEQQDGVSIYRLPEHHSWLWNHQSKFFKNSGIWNLVYLTHLAFGRNDPFDYNKYFRQYLDKILSVQRYDLIQVIIYPANLLNSVAKLALKYQTKYTVDLREYVVQDMAKIDQSDLTLSRRVKIHLEKKAIKNYLAQADFCTGVSTELLNQYSIPKHKSFEILNGYADYDWQKIKAKVPGSEKFVISSVGSLNLGPFLEIFLNSLQFFLNKYSNRQNIEIRFVGLTKLELIEQVKKHLHYPQVSIINERLENQLALEYMVNSNVLIYHGWQGYTGIYSSKIFDYLKAKRRILIVPGDNNVIDRLVQKCQAGLSCNNAEKGSTILSQWYSEWSETGKLECNSLDHKIIKYSRACQAEKLVDLIQEKYLLK